jgi:hypothetical protein
MSPASGCLSTTRLNAYINSHTPFSTTNRARNKILYLITGYSVKPGQPASFFAAHYTTIRVSNNGKKWGKRWDGENVCKLI